MDLPKAPTDPTGDSLKPSQYEQHPSETDDAAAVVASFFANLKSPLTIIEYKRTVRELISLTGIIHPRELKRYHIVFYKKFLEEKKLANKTIQKKMSGVSSFCKYLAEDRLIDKDITYGIIRPGTTNKRETSDLSDEEVKKVFSSLNKKNTIISPTKQFWR